jgi:DNA-binding transcriptional regulator GbsR (MarR family)
MSEAAAIRRDFALAWGRIGAAWGVAPSTASVQGYLLLHGEALTEAEIRQALGLSHRAAHKALLECESWGLVEQVEAKRVGRRGPPGRAWSAVGDHWEWFRSVAGVRKARETDPVLPLLDECLARAEASGDAQLQERVRTLLEFTHRFDRGVDAVVRSPSAAIAHLFGVLGRLDEPTLDRLLTAFAEIPEDELVDAATTLAVMRPELRRRFVGLAGSRRLARLIGS